MKTKRTQTRLIDKKGPFLAAFREVASVTEAARLVKIDRSLHYQWLENDPDYPAAFEKARKQAAQGIEDDIAQWARVGIFEPLVYQGNFCFAQRDRVKCLLPDGREVYREELPEDPEEYDRFEVKSTRTVIESYGPPLGIFRRSEGLMARLAKAYMPERYGDKTEISGPLGGPIETGLTVSFVRPKE